MEERLLDASWTRVDRFDPNRPLLRSNPSDAMDLDDEDHQQRGNGSGSEWEYEDTEELVTLDLGPESKRLFQMSHQFSVTGLETSEPYLKLGNVIFKGHWDKLLGTEIILKDEKDPSKSVPFQHDIQPLPATETDMRTGRAPSTTRHRIQFRPAVNMLARHNSLQDPANPTQVKYVSHKGGFVWKRGRGWIKKEQLNLLGEDDVVQNVTEENVGDGEQEEEASAQPEASSAPTKKMGRKKMTEEEKMRQSIWTSLKKIDRLKKKEGEGEVEAPNGEGSSQSGSSQGEADNGEEEDDEHGGEVT